jgi:cell division protein FtsZ
MPAAQPTVSPPKAALDLALDLKPTSAAAAKAAQEEFGFGEVESRGHFEKTDRNLFDGQDLDVPTYLRRGIKIAL